MASASTTRKAAFWDRIARKYAADLIADMAGYEATLRRVQALLTADQDALEIGCGTGTTALRLAPSVRRMLATDVSAAMITIAHEKLLAQPVPQLSFAVADADVPVFGQGAYDVALAFNLLHLVSDLDHALALAAQAWRPGWLVDLQDALHRRDESAGPLPRAAADARHRKGAAGAVLQRGSSVVSDCPARHGDRVGRKAWQPRQGYPCLHRGPQAALSFAARHAEPGSPGIACPLFPLPDSPSTAAGCRTER